MSLLKSVRVNYADAPMGDGVIVGLQVTLDRSLLNDNSARKVLASRLDDAVAEAIAKFELERFTR